MKMNEAIGQFVQYAIQLGGFMELDRKYLENKLQNKLQVAGAIPKNPAKLANLEKIITTLAKENNEIRAELLDLLTPPPSVVNAFFAQVYSKDPSQALENFYQLAVYNASTHISQLKQLADLGEINPNNYNLTNEGKQPEQRRYIRLNVKNKSYGFCWLEKQLFKMHGAIVSEASMEIKLPEVIDDLLELQQIFPKLQIMYRSIDQEKNRFYQVANDTKLFLKGKVLWKLEKQEVVIKQLDVNGTYLEIRSEKLMNLKVILNQLLYHYQDFDLLSYLEENEYVILLKLSPLEKGSYFGYDFDQKGQVTSLAKRVSEILERG